MKRSTLILILCLCTFSLTAQDIEDFVAKYSGELGEPYMQPAADALSANFNSGWFRHVNINKDKFQLYFGLMTMTTIVKDNQKTFTTSVYGQDAEVPTLLGDNEVVTVQDPSGSGLETAFPGGAGVTILPVAIPQLSLGGIAGTEASFRFFALDLGEDIGKINIFGWGLRHSVSQYFELLPVNIAVAYYWNTYEVEDYIDAKASVVSAQVGKRISIFDFYGALGYEFGSSTITYGTESGEETDIELDLDSENSVRFTAGVGFNFGPVKLNGEINLGQTNTFGVGFGFGFGEKKPE